MSVRLMDIQYQQTKACSENQEELASEQQQRKH